MTECVANYNRCPLIKLTVGDLTSEVQVVDETLRRYFKLASSWGAIILVDEADNLEIPSLAAGWYCTSSFGILFN